MALLARTTRRSLLSIPSVLPPTFLLPLRAGITTISHTLETGDVPDPLIQSGQHISKDLQSKVQSAPSIPENAPPPATQPQPPVNAIERLLTPSIKEMLPLLHAQPSHYLTIHIHGHPYLITPGDEIRLPFLMPRVKLGDILRLNRATHIGSRDYTLKAPEARKGTRDAPKKIFYLDARLFVCRATVVGIEQEPVRVMEKTKRRQRHVKHVYSQHRYTVIKISELKVRSLEEYEAILAPKESREPGL